jgi:hypothetical protein
MLCTSLRYTLRGVCCLFGSLVGVHGHSTHCLSSAGLGLFMPSACLCIHMKMEATCMHGVFCSVTPIDRENQKKCPQPPFEALETVFPMSKLARCNILVECLTYVYVTLVTYLTFFTGRGACYCLSVAKQCARGWSACYPDAFAELCLQARAASASAILLQHLLNYACTEVYACLHVQLTFPQQPSVLTTEAPQGSQHGNDQTPTTKPTQADT